VRVALRTQQILAYESGVADTVDPLAGSYLVENLTDEIEARALDYLERIDQMGGALQAIENGYMAGEIQESAYQHQRSVERKETTVVGVNAFQVNETLDLDNLVGNTGLEAQQVARLAELRANRDPGRVSELMNRLDTAARGSEELMPLLIECADQSITLGEICGILRQVWGEYQPASWN
jgi:methylmalonyl-CoA mutase N-terminal domain/subunit